MRVVEPSAGRALVHAREQGVSQSSAPQLERGIRVQEERPSGEREDGCGNPGRLERLVRPSALQVDRGHPHGAHEGPGRILQDTQGERGVAPPHRDAQGREATAKHGHARDEDRERAAAVSRTGIGGGPRKTGAIAVPAYEWSTSSRATAYADPAPSQEPTNRMNRRGAGRSPRITQAAAINAGATAAVSLLSSPRIQHAVLHATLWRTTAA